MEIHKNLIYSFKNYLSQASDFTEKKLFDCFTFGGDLSKVLEAEIQLPQMHLLKNSTIWIYDKNNKFKSFEDYKEFTEKYNPELIQSLENIEGFFDRLFEIINYLEGFGINLSKISINSRIYFSKIKEIEKASLEFSTPEAFRNNERNLYSSLHTFKKTLGEKWYKETTAHFKKGGIKWTPEAIEKEAKKYKTILKFRKANSSAYDAMRRHRKELGKVEGDKWFQKVAGHLEYKFEWKKEVIEEIYKSHNSLKAIKECNPMVIQAASRLKKSLGQEWFDEITSHLEHNNKMAYLEKEIKKFKTLSELIKKKPRLAGYLYRQKVKLGDDWFKDITSHLTPHCIPLSPERVIEEAKKHKTKTQFDKASPFLYKNLNLYRKKLGEEWYEKATSHFVCGNTKWTVEVLEKELKKYKYLKIFKISETGAYDALMKNKKKLGMDWYEKVTSHFIKENEERESKYIRKTLIPKLETFLKKKKINYSIETEVQIPVKNGEKGRIDIILNLIDNNIFIPIEVKHGESRTNWGYEKVNKQIAKYERAFSDVKGFIGVLLVSPKGRYGLSEGAFFSEMKKIVNNSKFCSEKTVKNDS